MKIISWNVNGLRAIHKRGFSKWLAGANAGIICLQETKAQKEQLISDLVKPKNYHSFFNSARRPGYSGVAVYSKKTPLSVKRKIGLEKFDREGRMLQLKFREFLLVNLYLPHGGRQKENLDYKLKVYDQLFEYLKKIKSKKLILIGDFNIAYKEIDLARPKQNKNNIMFMPEERKQVDKLIKLGLVDSFRKFNKKGGNYTWWPYFANARKRNLGWRIDYTFVSKKLVPKLKGVFILSEVQGSDHCPIGMEIEF